MDQLTQMAEDLPSGDSERAAEMQSLVDNFDTADTDGDGLLTREESMAYTEKNLTPPPSKAAVITPR